MKLKICIPTHMRETKEEQKTITYIPKELYKDVYFFTCETRVSALSAAIPSECNIIPVPKELSNKGIAGKRQFIVEWAHANGHNKIWQIDDRVSLQENMGAYDENRPTLKIMSIKDKTRLVDLLLDMEKKLDDYVIVGHLNRAGTFMERRELPHDQFKRDKENGRVYSSIGMRTDILIENDFRFDYLQKKFNDDSLSLMEDYSMLLQVISSGMKTLQIGSWCFDKSSFSGSGGCSNERNVERQKRVCEKLSEAFPRYVKVVFARDDTKAKSVKYNVRISWKQLSEDAARKKEFDAQELF